jgi:hypothetical protein
MSISLSGTVSLYYFAHYRALEIVCGVVSATLCHGILGVILGVEGAPPATGGPKNPATVDQKELLSVALVGGLTTVIIPIIWSWFNLLSLAQSLVTVLVLVNPNLEATRFTGFQRILGCLFGGAVGLFASLFASQSMILWSAIFILGMAGFSRLHFSGSRWAYTGTQGGIGFIFALVTGNGPPDTIVPVVNRIAGIMLGVLIFMCIADIVLLCRAGSAERERRGEARREVE